MVTPRLRRRTREAGRTSAKTYLECRKQAAALKRNTASIREREVGPRSSNGIFLLIEGTPKIEISRTEKTNVVLLDSMFKTT